MQIFFWGIFFPSILIFHLKRADVSPNVESVSHDGTNERSVNWFPNLCLKDASAKNPADVKMLKKMSRSLVNLLSIDIPILLIELTSLRIVLLDLILANFSWVTCPGKSFFESLYFKWDSSSTLWVSQRLPRSPLPCTWWKNRRHKKWHLSPTTLFCSTSTIAILPIELSPEKLDDF